MKNRYNLTQGNIMEQLMLVSAPVILTSFVQMAYNMIDLFWLGRIVGENAKAAENAVASAGTAGFFVWLGAALIMLVRIGTEVRISQSYGREDFDTAKIYAKTGVQLETIFALIYSVILIAFANLFIDFFRIDDINVYNDAVVFLRILSIGMLFNLLNPVLAATLNGTGNTVTPFIISSIGLVLNIILDPIFIFVLGFGVKGAAIATVIAQFIVTVIFIVIFSKNKNATLHNAKYFSKIDRNKATDILILGRPVAIQSSLFTLIAMYMGSIVFQFGSDASAVHKIGSQIEALSWLTAGGVQTALSAFVGQNFGAKKYDRVSKGIKYALITMTGYGILISLIFFIFPGPLFSIFLNKEGILPLGINYLKILAFSQLFMIIESLTGGAFNGLGKTIPSSIVSVTFNLLRIPMALLFIPMYGLDGIWLAITISSIFKGLVIYIWFKLYIRETAIIKHI